MVNIELPTPHLHQRQFIYSDAKRRMIRAGRRGGKTVGVATYAAMMFLSGHRVLYAAPTSDQTDTFWRHVRQSLLPLVLQKPTPFVKNDAERYFERAGTENRIKAKTAWNADTLRGDYADVLILDEYQMMNEDAWGVIGVPMLLDNDGIAIFIYTPPSVRTSGASRARDKRHAAKLFKRAQADTTGRWATFSFTSHDNPYLSKVALSEIAADMSALAYRQEILAEDVDSVPGALWNMDGLDKTRLAACPVELSRIVVGVDPKASVTADSKTGIVVAGRGEDGHLYVLEDGSLDGSPDAWGRQVDYMVSKWEADRAVAEVNQGGDMVISVLKTINPDLPIRSVRASRGKYVRAEPIAALYEQGKVHHVGMFPDLEDQMCSFVPGAPSPDNLDALVWALTDLNTRTSLLL